MCNVKDMIVAIIGAFIGLLIVEFLFRYFIGTTIVLWQLVGYTLALAIVFGTIFTFLTDSLHLTKHWFRGLKLGVFYGAISSLPLGIASYFLTSQAFVTIAVSIVFALVEYGVAGATAMYALAKYGTKKRRR